MGFVARWDVNIAWAGMPRSAGGLSFPVVGDVAHSAGVLGRPTAANRCGHSLTGSGYLCQCRAVLVELDAELTRQLIGGVPAAFTPVQVILLIAFGLAWLEFWALAHPCRCRCGDHGRDEIQPATSTCIPPVGWFHHEVPGRVGAWEDCAGAGAKWDAALGAVIRTPREQLRALPDGTYGLLRYLNPGVVWAGPTRASGSAHLGRPGAGAGACPRSVGIGEGEGLGSGTAASAIDMPLMHTVELNAAPWILM